MKNLAITYWIIFLIISLFLMTFCRGQYLTWKQIEPYVISECLLYPKSKIVKRHLIHAMMYWESRDFKTCAERYKTNAVSSDGCVGLMQIKSNTLDDYNMMKYGYDKDWKFLTMDDISDIKLNIKIGVWCLLKKLEKAKRYKVPEERRLARALQLYSGSAKNYPEKVLEKALKLYMEE